MAKSEKIKFSGQAALLDGIEARRVQTLGSTTDISRDQVLELANSGVVQYIDNIPTVSITLDTNEYGSTDTVALVCDKVIQYSNKAAADPTRTGTMDKDIQTGKKNSWTVIQTDLLNSYVDIIAAIRPDADTAVNRSYWIHRAALTGYALSYNVDGVATENFTLTSDNKTYYLNAWKGIRATKLRLAQIGSYEGASAAAVKGQRFYFEASALPKVGAAFQATPIGMGINENIFRSGVSGITFSNFSSVAALNGTRSHSSKWGSFKLYGIATAYAASTNANDRVIAIWKMNQGTQQAWTGTTWALGATAGSIGGLTRGYIYAQLWNTAGPSNETSADALGRTLRLQSVAIDASLSSDALTELGRFQSYGIIRQDPIPVVVTVTANDTDLDMFARAAGTSDANAKYVYTDMFNGTNALRLRVYKAKDSTVAANLLRTIEVRRMVVNSENQNIAVGGVATQEMVFQGDNISIKGSSINPE